MTGLLLVLKIGTGDDGDKCVFPTESTDSSYTFGVDLDGNIGSWMRSR